MEFNEAQINRLKEWKKIIEEDIKRSEELLSRAKNDLDELHAIEYVTEHFPSELRDKSIGSLVEEARKKHYEISQREKNKIRDNEIRIEIIERFID